MVLSFICRPLRQRLVSQLFFAFPQFSTYGPLRIRGPDWSLGENDTIRELHAKGSSVRQMMPMLPGRTFSAITSRTAHVKYWEGQPSTRSSSTKWSLGDDARLMQLVKDGQSLSEARKHFPTRTLGAVRGRWAYHLRPAMQTLSQSRSRRKYSPAEIAEIMERYQADETVGAIAARFDRSHAGIARLLYRRVPENMKRTVGGESGRRLWSCEDDERLRRLCRSATQLRDIPSHFPDRSPQAVRIHIRSIERDLRQWRVASTPSKIVHTSRTLEVQARILDMRREKRIGARSNSSSRTCVSA